MPELETQSSEETNEVVSEQIPSKGTKRRRFWTNLRSVFQFLRAIPAGRLLLIVIIGTILLSPIAGGLFWQRFVSVYDNWFFNPGREGLIVVDSPQVFTRERLVNQRLRDSAWLDEQLEAVNQKLEDGEFSKPDVLANQDLTVSLLQKSLDETHTDGDGAPTSDGQAQDGTEQLTKLTDLIQPDPISVFREAQFYREMLSQSRYEAILDDAHDIGSNTLQKLNFRMTITPARQKSDSLAATTITIEEPEEVELLFQYYGKLLIETRKELESTVTRLTADRNQVLQPYSTYMFSGNASALLDQALATSFAYVFGVPIDVSRNAETIAHAVKREREQRVVVASASIKRRIVDDRDFPGLVELLYPDASGSMPREPSSSMFLDASIETSTSQQEQKLQSPSFEELAGPTAVNNCDRQLSLLDLAPSVFESPALMGKMQSEYNTIKQQMRLRQQQAQGSGSSQDQGSQQEFDPKQLEADFSSFMHAKKYRYECPSDFQSNVRAKLRVIGALRLLQHSAGGRSPCMDVSKAAKRELIVQNVVSFFMLNAPLGDEFEDCEIEVDALKALRPSASSRWDIGQIGVSYLVLEELRSTQVDSMVRARGLDDYFKFTIDDCAPLSCSISTRTLAEAKMHDLQEKAWQEQLGSFMTVEPPAPPIKKDPDPEKNVDFETPPQPPVIGNDALDISALRYDKDIVREIAREEALRLYAELSCFARARSYTVWPRSGETKRALNRNSSSFQMLGEFLANMTAGSSASMSSTSFSETQHVFGIGDGGQPSERPFNECDTSFFWMLDTFEPDGKFVTHFFDDTEWEKAPPTVTYWRNMVICMIAKDSDTECASDPVALKRQVEPMKTPETIERVTISDFMRVVRERRDYDTNVSWIVIPEQDSALTPKRHVPKSVPLSAIVSLPSWWPSAKITIRTCWLRPKTMLKHNNGADFCKDTVDDAGKAHAEKGTGKGLAEEGKRHSHASSESVFPVQLPSNAQDVLQKLGFFIIRTPYLDQQPGGLNVSIVEAGRMAQLRLTGSRLWKNPRVRLGDQWHSGIEVLPDMKGIIATFECIDPTKNPDLPRIKPGQEKLIDIEREGRFVVSQTENASGSSGGKPGQGQSGMQGPRQNRPEMRTVEVWTSEGVTGQTTVEVRPFRPSFVKAGVYEKPCWPVMKTGESSEN